MSHCYGIIVFNMAAMYQIFKVPEQKEESIETLGTKAKFWFKHKGESYLWKENRPNTGEHWSEKISCELCGLISLPHAHYELATYKGKKGVISPYFLPSGGSLNFGNQLLVNRVKGYQVTRFHGVKDHTIEIVLKILGSKGSGGLNVKPPYGWEETHVLRRGVEFFVGYLMLDAWIGNQDRHHENWGLIWTQEKINHLAPSYDHASSLGRNESDEKRLRCLNNKGRDGRLIIENYVEKAKSAFYSAQSLKRLKTTEAFEHGAKKYKCAGKYWIERIYSVSDKDVNNILNGIPKTEISETSIEFVRKMLILNKSRILDIGSDLL